MKCVRYASLVALLSKPCSGRHLRAKVKLALGQVTDLMLITKVTNDQNLSSMQNLYLTNLPRKNRNLQWCIYF